MNKFAKKASRAKQLSDEETIKKVIQNSIESTDNKVSAKEIQKIEDGLNCRSSGKSQHTNLK